MPAEKLTVAAIVENLDRAIAFIEDRAELFGLETKKKFGLLIAVEEAFVNVCHYAYPESGGEVSLVCHTENTDFVVEIIDRGGAFDLLSLPAPDITAGIMDRQVGGLGVHFIRNLTDDVSYRREDGRNIVRMTMRKAAESPHDS